MSKILVTGANGQLGRCLKDQSIKARDMDFIFVSSKELNIENQEAINYFFEKENFDFCINCAAYTAVDKAEVEKDKAFNTNCLGVKYLSMACQKNNVDLIHISTDFVFNGNSSLPYKEEDETFPLSVYGETKLQGEQEIRSRMKNYYIIRTSWLYSQYGHNFLKTMLRLSQTHKELNIVNDQIGTPTYANDLAQTIFLLINSPETKYGIYHYSNEGRATWFDFAKAIFEENNIKITIKPINTIDYPTPAKRPKYSVLDTSKIKKTLKINIPNWRDRLKKAKIEFLI